MDVEQIVDNVKHLQVELETLQTTVDRIVEKYRQTVQTYQGDLEETKRYIVARMDSLEEKITNVSEKQVSCCSSNCCSLEFVVKPHIPDDQKEPRIDDFCKRLQRGRSVLLFITLNLNCTR